MFKLSVPAAQQKHFASVIKTNNLKPHKEMITPFWKPYENMNALCGRISNFLMLNMVILLVTTRLRILRNELRRERDDLLWFIDIMYFR
jgi:hypothetical protein